MYLQLCLAPLCLRLEEAVEQRVVAEMVGFGLGALLKGTMARRRQAGLQEATSTQQQQMPPNAAERIWVLTKTVALRGQEDLQVQGLLRQESSGNLEMHRKGREQKKGILSLHMLRRTLHFLKMNLAEHPLLLKQRTLKGDVHQPTTNAGLILNEVPSRPYTTSRIERRGTKTCLTNPILICGPPARSDGATIPTGLRSIRGSFTIKCPIVTVVKGEQIAVEGCIVGEGQEIMAFPARIRTMARIIPTAIHLNIKLPCNINYPNYSPIMSDMHRSRMVTLITVLSQLQELFVLVLVRDLFPIQTRIAGFLALRMDPILDHLNCPPYRPTWQTHMVISQASRAS